MSLSVVQQSGLTHPTRLPRAGSGATQPTTYELESRGLGRVSELRLKLARGLARVGSNPTRLTLRGRTSLATQRYTPTRNERGKGGCSGPGLQGLERYEEV